MTTEIMPFVEVFEQSHAYRYGRSKKIGTDDSSITAVTSITADYIYRRVPIDIDRFERSEETDLTSSGRTNAERILGFLATNSGQAYTPKEIHDETGIPRGSVGVVLSRLEERELVRHRGEYWAIGESEAVETTLDAMATARDVSERFGPEDPEEWGPGVDAEDR